MKYLVLAFLLLATLASADTIDYSSGGSGKDVTVTGKPAAGMIWSVTDDLTSIDDTTTGKDQQGGELGTVDITTGKIFSCSSGLCFKGGDVDIKSEKGVTIVNDMFTGGVITTSGGNTFLNATLQSASGGSTEIEAKNGVFSSNTIVGSAAIVPEPNALLLMGTGLLGLSFIRKVVH